MNVKSTLQGLTIAALLMGSGPVAASDPTPAAPENCRTEDAPQPTVTLAFGSRYKADSKSRSDIDPEGNAEVTNALKPIDDFIRIIASEANKALEGDEPIWRADCIVSAMRGWADARALEDLQTFTAQLSVGSRIAGLALAYLQVRDLSDREDDKLRIDLWLRRMTSAQVLFWEDGATPGAQKGNLRGWATLGFASVGLALDDRFLLTTAAQTADMLMCTANPDGSLPQEMRRGKYALHYQLHAIAPLVVTTGLLRDADLAVEMPCADTLPRIVEFALSDLSDGARSQAYNGKVQSYFDGTETFEQHEFAWLVAYAGLPVAQPDDLPLQHVPDGPYRNSKLGGDQNLLWSSGRFRRGGQVLQD